MPLNYGAIDGRCEYIFLKSYFGINVQKERLKILFIYGNNPYIKLIRKKVNAQNYFTEKGDKSEKFFKNQYFIIIIIV